MTKAQAREKLWEVARCLHFDEEYANRVIDDFAAACVAEAYEAMQAEAERRFELNSAEPGFGPSAQAVAYGRLADWAKAQAKKARDGK